MIRATEEARMLGHSRVGGDHLLLGLIGEVQSIDRADWTSRLRALLMLDLDGVRERVKQRADPSRQDSSGGLILLDDIAERILTAAGVEANRAGKVEEVRAHHILAAVCATAEGTVRLALEGSDPHTVEDIINS